MAETLKKMRWLLILNILGVAIILMYLMIKGVIGTIKLIRTLMPLALVYLVAFIMTILFMRVVHNFVDIKEFIYSYGSYIAHTISGYVMAFVFFLILKFRIIPKLESSTKFNDSTYN